MKIVGIFGGIGPESTIDYYRSIIASYVERSPDGHYPALLINSLDLRAFLALFESDQRAQAAKLLSEAVEALEGRVERILVHFDLDVADTPAVDVAHSNGLPLETTVEVLKVFMQSPKCAGLVVTEFNPALDVDGSVARSLATHLAETLSAARHPR